MKKLTVIFIAIFTMSFAFQSVNAQTANGDANVNIYQALDIQAAQALRFGSLQSSTTSAEPVAISTQGVSLTTLTEIGTLHSQGTFNITGSPLAPYQVTLPADGDIDLVAIGFTGDDMAVTSFIVRCSSEGADGTSGTIAAAGTASIEVGATLLVGQSQAAGYYTATYPVTVAYE